MIGVQSIDLGGLEFMLRGLQSALIGTGQDGDASKFVADETRLLSMEIARQMSPKTQAVGERNVKRDVGRFLSAKDPSTDPAMEGHGDLRWISVSSKFVTGISPDDDWRQADNGAGLTLLQVERNNPRGDRYVELGVRGSQVVRRLNRPVVTPLVKFNLTRILGSHIGRLKASWAETAEKKGQKNIPSWIRRHFPTPKNTTRENNSPETPSVEFGSSAPGIGKFKPQISNAVRNRKAKLRIRIKQALFGYAQDANHGKTIRRHVKEESHAVTI